MTVSEFITTTSLGTGADQPGRGSAQQLVIAGARARCASGCPSTPSRAQSSSSVPSRARSASRLQAERVAGQVCRLAGTGPEARRRDAELAAPRGQRIGGVQLPRACRSLVQHRPSRGAAEERTRVAGQDQVARRRRRGSAAVRTSAAGRALAERVRVVAADDDRGRRPRCRRAAAAPARRRPRSRRRTGRGSATAGAADVPMTSWRRCQALSIRPSQNANDPPPCAKQIRSDSSTRSNTPPRIMASIDRWVSAGMPTSHCAIQRSSRGELGMSHGWTNTGAPSAARSAAGT